jgi:hypothetical protein
VAIDGKIDKAEWAGAFCTPVHYGHARLEDRAAMFFYQWDEKALYVGLRALDRHRADVGDDKALWNGDAVEFYLDTRAGQALRGKDWTAGAIHFFFTPFEGVRLHPRWVMRGGIATSDTKLEGVELAAMEHEWGYEVELKLPWANFPEFRPKVGTLLAMDAELCSGDGQGRTDRTFAYGSPLSVQQPASQGLVELVERLDPADLATVGPACFPFWVETPWVQAERARVVAVLAIPPALADRVGAVAIRIHDADGRVVRTLPARVGAFGPGTLGFVRAVASWSIDDYAPNTYFVTARVESKEGKPLTTVAPRMVQEAQMTGR